MFRSLLGRAVLGATLPALLLAPDAFAAGPHKEQIELQSWSFPASGTGKTLAAQVLATDPVQARPVLLLKCAEGSHLDA